MQYPYVHRSFSCLVNHLKQAFVQSEQIPSLLDWLSLWNDKHTISVQIYACSLTCLIVRTVYVNMYALIAWM